MVNSRLTKTGLGENSGAELISNAGGNWRNTGGNEPTVVKMGD